MFLVKFTDPEWKQAAVSGDSIRIGSVLYYREIHDPTFRDEDEGEGSVVYKSKKPLDAETYNRIFIDGGHQLNDGWTVDMGGTPLISQKSIFNPFIFSCSLVRRKSDIAKIAKKFNKKSQYYIGDVWKFVDSVSESLRNYIILEIESNDEMYSPKEVREKLHHLEILPVIGKIVYTNEKKEKIVDEVDAVSFNARTFEIMPYFKKPKAYSDEQEFRIIWLPNLGDIDKNIFDFITTTIRTVDLSLSNHGLTNRPKSIKEILNKNGKKIV